MARSAPPRRRQAPRPGPQLVDAPAFTITADDPFAAGLVMLWACLRNGDTAGALDEFNSLVQSESAQGFEGNPDTANADRAADLAQQMEDWLEPSN